MSQIIKNDFSFLSFVKYSYLHILFLLRILFFKSWSLFTRYGLCFLMYEQVTLNNIYIMKRNIIATGIFITASQLLLEYMYRVNVFNSNCILIAYFVHCKLCCTFTPFLPPEVVLDINFTRLLTMFYFLLLFEPF